MKFAVAGGTGAVGSLVVDAARAAGHDVVVMSRSHGVDLVSGRGLAAALEGVHAVIDAVNVSTVSKAKSVRFFQATTGNLLAASAAARVGHVLALSIVGIDDVPFGYYQGKVAQERLLTAGPTPWTVLRATQFHEFAGQLLDRARGPFVVVPRMRTATVAAREAAELVVSLAEGDPCGYAPELAGPQTHEMPDLVRRLALERGARIRVLAVRLPGRAGAQMAGGALLPTGDGRRGRLTFDDWLVTAPR